MEKQQSEQKLFYTTGELAKLARVSSAYIRMLCISGQLQGQKIGRDWMIPASEVKRFMSGREGQ